MLRLLVSALAIALGVALLLGTVAVLLYATLEIEKIDHTLAWIPAVILCVVLGTGMLVASVYFPTRLAAFLLDLLSSEKK